MEIESTIPTSEMEEDIHVTVFDSCEKSKDPVEVKRVKFDPSVKGGEVSEGEEQKEEIGEIDIEHYERNLKQATEDTVSLLHRLCKRTDELRRQQVETLSKLEEAKNDRNVAEGLIASLTEENRQLVAKQNLLEEEIRALRDELNKAEQGNTDAAPPKQQLWIEWQNVEAARVGECLLSRPTGATILPEGRILVADLDLGLLLFSIHSELIKQVQLPDWRWPQAPVFLPADNVIVVSMLLRDNNDAWRRHICRFDLNLNMVNKIAGPMEIQDEQVTHERLCSASNGFLYLTATSETFSSIYELSPTGKWTELHNKKGQTIADIQVLAVIESITELLVVEQRKGYVWMLSVRESQIVARKTLALVERPGAIAVDDHRQLFIHDQHQGKIREISTVDGFEPLRDIAIADASLRSIAAANGYIAVAFTDRKLVRIHRYASRK